MGPALGFHINLGKCELFARRGNTFFPSAIPLPNLVILGAPVGDYIPCSRVIAELRTQAKPLLQCLQEMAGIDLQVAVTLLRVAGSYCRMTHLVLASPPTKKTLSFKMNLFHGLLENASPANKALPLI